VNGGPTPPTEGRELNNSKLALAIEAKAAEVAALAKQKQKAADADAGMAADSEQGAAAAAATPVEGSARTNSQRGEFVGDIGALDTTNAGPNPPAGSSEALSADSLAVGAVSAGRVADNAGANSTASTVAEKAGANSTSTVAEKTGANSTGREARAAVEKVGGQKGVRFTEEEWESFKVKSLRNNDFIRAGDDYYCLEVCVHVCGTML